MCRHTSGVVGDKCFHESRHDGSERGYSRETTYVCHRTKSQKNTVTEDVFDRCGSGTVKKKKEGCVTRKESRCWWRQSEYVSQAS